MEYRKNLYPGIILTIISAAYLALSGQIEIFTGSGATPLDARFMPRLWGTVLLILSLILVVRGIKQRKAAVASGEIDASKKSLIESIADSREVLLSFVFLAIYVAIMEPIGFLISTAVYLYAEILLLTEKSKRNYIIPLIVAIIFAVGIDFIFVRFLNVLLPAGIFGF